MLASSTSAYTLAVTDTSECPRCSDTIFKSTPLFKSKVALLWRKQCNGFKALYYHYLYLFSKIRKKETPQRVSFYIREELIKFERYQKQFNFMIDNNIETIGQLNDIIQNAEYKIAELTLKRTRLYSKSDVKDEISDINTELKKLRMNVRMCNNILIDTKRISERYKEAIILEQKVVMQNNSKNKNGITR